MRVYIGTYTSGKSHGIYTAQFDSETGRLAAPELAAESKNPTFLAVHPDGRELYAANEIDNFDGKPEGAVSAFRIDKETGRLTLLNQQGSGGRGPCHLSVAPKNKCVLVANYGSGSVAALPLDAEGKLHTPATMVQHQGSSINPKRQAGPHAHFICPDPANRFALACDLGLDKILVYQLESREEVTRLEPNQPADATVDPGAGARHLAFHPNGQWLYVVNELASSVSAFSYDARHGQLEPLGTVSALPADFHGTSTAAEVQVHPSGKFVYASNRGDNSLAVFAVDPRTGTLRLLERQPTLGQTPRHFTFDPSGRWLLVENQDSDNIVTFAVKAETGRLTPTGQIVNLGAPVCLVFIH